MKRFYFLGIVILGLLLFPIILWLIEPQKELQIAILDKTVPDETYREHLGISWLLNHLKYSNESGNSYKASENYYGFHPNEEDKNHKIKPLPTDYNDYDVIYLADTYGVYEGDLAWQDAVNKESITEKIYGGLEEEEWNAIIDRLNQSEKSLLVAEYNTFASPTNEAVRESVAENLGLEWSGWTGRFFKELDPAKTEEIPQWILNEFEKEWNYSGEGFILVNDINFEVVVLESGEEVNGGIRLSYTKEGIDEFGELKSPDYNYWFDIVTAKDKTTVLANYDWDLTKDGKTKLEENNIPTEFAAVLQNEFGAATSYYFAGDFNDVADVPRFYQATGLTQIYKLAQSFSDNAFYWSSYVPMMESILDTHKAKSMEEATAEENEMQYTARVEGNRFEVWQDNEWTSLAIKGVNMGMAKPGVYPGEAAITEDEYYRWFEQIAEMNANTVRVYTLHPPGFYNALLRYNESHEEKIYIMHGVWINEENLEHSLDAFEEENLADFQDEMRKIVDVIHGNKIVKQKPGHASGAYRADISDYVIGWVLGIEWYPFMVENTNKIHASIGDYNGTYFETKNAQPFEYFLAEQMDLITTYEIAQYQKIRPISFTNWVTTDILDHPSDSSGQEDIVSVDPNVIYTKNDMTKTEQFASYHIYPYYPDFLNYDEKYQTYKDHRGEYNNYAGYLAELRDAHRLPILVAEFGVPGSRGLTHENPFGWNQGFLSETEQGEIISHLYEDIIEEELMGGLIFTWQDEWFKRTWNTMDYDNPDRRPFWSNAQTNEQQFGLLSFDRHKIKVDGDPSEWENSSFYKKETGPLKAMFVDHDERYLYLRVDLDEKKQGSPILLLDILPEQGNLSIKGKDHISFENGIDFLIDLNKAESRMKVDAYYDFYTYQYGHQLELLEPKPPVPTKNSGEFNPIRLALNKAYYIPDQDKTIPFSSYETGKLKKGNGNPNAKDYDSLVDYSESSSGVLELRIPWLLIQAKDPSKKEFIGDIYKDGITASEVIEEINIGVLYENSNGEIIDSFPKLVQDSLGKLKAYTWDKWDLPQSEERLKQSYGIIQDLYSSY